MQSYNNLSQHTKCTNIFAHYLKSIIFCESQWIHVKKSADLSLSLRWLLYYEGNRASIRASL